ncbi:MAG: hypothetical protein RBT63_05820, partial [Bdellovibrionales bacterium]|nr:hypothetical protein [Bdellovibrionales bacterium]
MNPRSLISKAIRTVLAVQLVYLPTGLPMGMALKIQLTDDIKLRQSVDGDLERVGLLKRGTVIEIPDAFVVTKNGKPDLELTLNNWLRNASREQERPGLYKFDGEKHDYFFPIKVVKPAPGSTLGSGDETKFIALKFMARNGGALIVSEDAPLHTEESLRRHSAQAQRESRETERLQKAAKAQPPRIDTQMEAQSPC